MKTTHGLGWLAAGVMAMGLNGLYHDGGMQLAQRVAERTSQRAVEAMTRSAAHADQLSARVETFVARERTLYCRLAASVARWQAQGPKAETQIAETVFIRKPMGISRLDRMSARDAAEMARVQINRATAGLRAQRLGLVAFSPPVISVPHFAAVCPRIQVVVPRPMMHIPAPSIPMRTMGTKPI